MILWGRHSDRTGERRWHTAIPLLLAAFGFSALNLTGAAIIPTVLAVSCCLVGAYSFKAPFWALSAGWLSASTLAAGLAGINAIANLIGGGMMVNAVGLLKEWSGSYAIGMIPLVLLTLAGAVSVLVISRSHARETAAAAVAA
jgi:ACS family tartrate transporter-like MFS transporter